MSFNEEIVQEEVLEMLNQSLIDNICGEQVPLNRGFTLTCNKEGVFTVTKDNEIFFQAKLVVCIER